MNGKIKVKQLSLIGVMGALVFVSSSISFQIGEVSRLHLGNVMCLLSGFILGPFGGGFAAGIGSVLYDFTNPLYTPSAPFTFVFKFIMAFICGKIAYSRNSNALDLKMNVLAAVAGNFSYTLLYTGRAFAENLFLYGMKTTPAMIAAGQKFYVSLINLIIACIVSVPLAQTLKQTFAKLNINSR